jgi:aspartate/methionine/tyrosine aminotransferase
MFSARLPPRLDPNRLSRAAAEARASGRRLIDLTLTNPTTAGIPYPPAVASSLAAAAAVPYEPDSRGLRSARSAVVSTLPVGTNVDPDQIVLTASTSEAYAVLFKLLCDPGDEVLVPRPSYPLFDLLGRLEGVVVRHYALEYHDGWAIDRGRLEAALTARTRAVLVVSPNNPTGSMLHAGDRDWLAGLAARRGVAIVADEVFGDYPLRPPSTAASLVGERRALTFTLGGLSKSCGLPQHKLAWTIVSGPDAAVHEALRRLEVISDTYLSVASPVQAALPSLLAAGREVRRVILSRLQDNLAALRRATAHAPDVTLLEPEGGWSAVLRVPAVRSEEQMALAALDRGVVVHPGYFFDFETEAFFVASLLVPPDDFGPGIERLLEAVRTVPA